MTHRGRRQSPGDILAEDMLADDLGKTMHSQAIVLQGRCSEAVWTDFLKSCAEDMGMSPVGEPAIWRYPTAGGKGGQGMTLCLPITESFLVLDTWSRHDGAYLFIASCKDFSHWDIADVVSDYGLTIKDASKEIELRLA